MSQNVLSVIVEGD